MTRPDSWSTTEAAEQRLVSAGYAVAMQTGHLAYRKTGVSGRITIHPQGVDAWAVLRLEDRGS